MRIAVVELAVGGKRPRVGDVEGCSGSTSSAASSCKLTSDASPLAKLIGCQIAVEQINAKGGILRRNVELIAEDSTSGDAGTAVLKARKLIDGDKVDFLLGNTNSALSLAMAEVSSEKKILHVVPGGHTDAVTGARCHWNVFRVCNTTQMEAVAITGTLIKNYNRRLQ
jgi:branched-chain amino acid transport system substrate-binding protein